MSRSPVDPQLPINQGSRHRHEHSGFGNAIVKIIERTILFMLVILLVWVSYVYLFAYHPDTLGWIYTLLRPVTIWLYSMIDSQLPETVKFKVSAGLTDELGPRALFLLLLAGVWEAFLLTLLAVIRAISHWAADGR